MQCVSIKDNLNQFSANLAGRQGAKSVVSRKRVWIARTLSCSPFRREALSSLTSRWGWCYKCTLEGVPRGWQPGSLLALHWAPVGYPPLHEAFEERRAQGRRGCLGCCGRRGGRDIEGATCVHRDFSWEKFDHVFSKYLQLPENMCCRWSLAYFGTFDRKTFALYSKSGLNGFGSFPDLLFILNDSIRFQIQNSEKWRECAYFSFKSRNSLILYLKPLLASEIFPPPSSVPLWLRRGSWWFSACCPEDLTPAIIW